MRDGQVLLQDVHPLVSRGVQTAIPMEHPYCSWKMTRARPRGSVIAMCTQSDPASFLIEYACPNCRADNAIDMRDRQL